MKDEERRRYGEQDDPKPKDGSFREPVKHLQCIVGEQDHRSSALSLNAHDQGSAQDLGLVGFDVNRQCQ